MAKDVSLSQGKVAIVDDEDYESVSLHKWYYDGGYAVRNVRISSDKRVRERLHRFIMKPTEKDDDLVIDHINRNTLDNRKTNLRWASRSQNIMNSCKKSKTARYKGITYHATTKKWRARIGIGNKRFSLGLFDSQEDAASAYDRAARDLFNEFALTNF